MKYYLLTKMSNGRFEGFHYGAWARPILWLLGIKAMPCACRKEAS